MLFGIMEGSSVSRSFHGAMAEQAKSTETNALSARCPSSNCSIPDEDVDVSIIIYLPE
jgi:hypothetical protein